MRAYEYVEVRMQCACSAREVPHACTACMRTLEDKVELLPVALRHEPLRVVRGGVAHELAARV